MPIHRNSRWRSGDAHQDQVDHQVVLWPMRSLEMAEMIRPAVVRWARPEGRLSDSSGQPGSMSRKEATLPNTRRRPGRR